MSTYKDINTHRVLCFQKFDVMTGINYEEGKFKYRTTSYRKTKCMNQTDPRFTQIKNTHAHLLLFGGFQKKR